MYTHTLNTDSIHVCAYSITVNVIVWRGHQRQAICPYTVCDKLNKNNTNFSETVRIKWKETVLCVDMCLQLMTAPAVFLRRDSSKKNHSANRTSRCCVIATMVTHTIRKIFRQNKSFAIIKLSKSSLNGHLQCIQYMPQRFVSVRYPITLPRRHVWPWE